MKAACDMTGFKVVDNSVEQWGFAEMATEMGRSTFCLAATGAGWGVRLKYAAMFHCIPVVIADAVQVCSSYRNFKRICLYHTSQH